MSERMTSAGTEELRRFLDGLDEPHFRYAQAYGDQLSLGDPKPSSAGLDRDTVREIRRLVWAEWRRRIAAMPGSRRAS